MDNNCMSEMATYMPVSGGFVRMAGRWVGDEFGIMASRNFFSYKSLLIHFEITATNLALSFGEMISLLLPILNILAVRAYGEA
ncbi:hypothetical protein K469DRAFT_794601 [Zopfia rhizophila CBS 207.26]|uniref:Amino acid permease/ SLC12A domain-containing protein n=1 Tax=Zopfia rhizophila CBS 207.26 TaxID=1314779 RepID=A0A6A6DLH6_9PEZI|nr:hypothetical protein K469DRAFT_794601 [Zopfia rhizophila CBS 207.26]